ncbi:MAG TPA: MarP family serine protease [Mycobacteriales bacterium]|nr:MarP family serine protease [Mycobacteriales bacterium]
MDVLDLVLILVCLGFAVSGYRQGFLIGILSFLGFLGGGALGAKYAPALHDAFGDPGNSALFGLLVVFVAATVGQLVATGVGIALRRRITWHPVRVVDSVGGGVVSVISVLLVAWLIGTALAHSQLTTLARQVRHSLVLAQIDGVMPDSARTWFSSFRRLLDQNGFPQVFGAIGPETIVKVPPPDPRVANSRTVRLAHADVVKITGVAPSCRRQLEGSGFLYAPEHVMTNAHVVAGVRNPQVSAPNGRTYPARVVLYDPRRDVAVLDVPGFSTPQGPLAFAAEPADRGQSAIVVGYPQNGPFRPVAARVRGRQEARGPDIYQSSQVTREIYSVFAVVRPGNSGGPLLDGALVNGHPVVYGVVFAAAVDDPHTGYALTSGEVMGDARAGARATAPVSTQSCD